MSNLEHYFENLLFMGKDVNGDWNKNSLTEEEQNAVEMCAQYVLYSLFCGREDMKETLALSEVTNDPIKHGKWEYDVETGGFKCTECGKRIWSTSLELAGINYCPNCGARMES